MTGQDPTRQLPDVFKELQQARFEQQINTKLNVKKTSARKKKKSEKLAQKREMAYRNTWNAQTADAAVLEFSVKKAAIATMCVCALVLTLVSKNYIFATADKEKEIVETSSIEFESNENSINLTQIVSQNATMVEAKDYVKEERVVKFETVYLEDTSLQKDEKIVMQEGKNGKEQVSVVKTYENGEFVKESILERNVIEKPVNSVVHVGTSQFLSTYNVHLGDTLYLTEDSVLRKKASESSKEVCKIDKYMDVKLLELSGDWAKVSFDDEEGYIKCTSLTSASVTPSIAEENRKQRVFSKVAEDMSLNEVSGLSLEDFKKVLSNNSSDTNKIFEDNAEAFYYAEQKYKVNGIFIAAIGINESAWGTSNIAQTKKNLFGYGSYDSDPFNSSYTFENYEDGIDLVSKVMAKYYLNPAGTKIYDGEIASGKYYNGSTVAAVNIRYASDTEWHTKVYSYMEYLYNKLK